jgi:predicted nicotinamide N-methyase
LELGSGTGLVGLAAAAVLSVMGATAEVVLSDNDPHTLANLSRNFAANADLFASPAITVSTRALDWRAEPVDGDARFDVLLGGDVVYDTHHAGLLRRAIETHLAPGGTAHIVMALRPTHTVELRQVEVVFVEDAACRLVIAKRETEVVDGEPLAYESLWIRWR